MLPREDIIGEKREAALMKARQTIGLKRHNSSSRRDILVPDRPADMHTPLIMSAANPLGSKISMGGVNGLATSKPRIPLPKRGNSLSTANRGKTSSGVEFAKGTKEGAESGRGATPTGSQTNSTAFSKRSGAQGMPYEDGNPMLRPQTEYLPSASQEFGEKVKQGRLRPIRNKSKSGQQQREKSKKFNNVAENYLNEHTNKQNDILKAKKKELAALDDEMEDFMNVAGDGNYNLKILNDAFEGKAHENEEIDLINIDGEMRIKKRTKRPVAIVQRPEAKTASAAFAAPIKEDMKKATKAKKEYKERMEAKRDPRVANIVEDVMRRSA